MLDGDNCDHGACEFKTEESAQMLLITSSHAYALVVPITAYHGYHTAIYYRFPYEGGGKRQPCLQLTTAVRLGRHISWDWRYMSRHPGCSPKSVTTYGNYMDLELSTLPRYAIAPPTLVTQIIAFCPFFFSFFLQSR